MWQYICRVTGSNFAFYSKSLYEHHGVLTWKLLIKFAMNVFYSLEKKSVISRPSTFHPRPSTFYPRPSTKTYTSVHYCRGSRVKCWGSRVECGGSIVKLKQKDKIKHSLIKWRSNSPMSHDIFCMILDLWRRTAGELISWHSSSGEWGCSLYL